MANNKRERRRVELFDEMARDLADGDQVRCPICMKLFGRDAVRGANPALTIEHVIPHALRSHADTLTCSVCNSGEQKNVEAELVARVRFEDALKGRGGDVAARIQTSEGEQVVRVAIDKEGTVDIVGCPGSHNNPRAKALIEQFERGDVEDFRLTFSNAYDEHRSRVALVKAAYLFLFKNFGYAYIRRPALDIVRRQILNPDERLAPTSFVTTLDAGVVGNRPEFVEGRATYLLCGEFVMVVLDVGTDRLVGVPLPGRRGTDVYALLERTKAPGVKMRFSIGDRVDDMTKSDQW